MKRKGKVTILLNLSLSDRGDGQFPPSQGSSKPQFWNVLHCYLPFSEAQKDIASSPSI